MRPAGRPRIPGPPSARLPAACARAPANDDWPLAPSGANDVRPASRARVRAKSRAERVARVCRPAAELSDTDTASGAAFDYAQASPERSRGAKPRRTSRIPRVIPLQECRFGITRTQRQARNAAREMRFPVSRGTGDDAVSRSHDSRPPAGTPSRTERSARGFVRDTPVPSRTERELRVDRRLERERRRMMIGEFERPKEHMASG